MRELRQANTEKGWDKYMKKITGVWIIGILALIVLAGCGQREQGKEIEKKAVNIEEENKTTIGLSFDSFVIERWLRDRDAFVAAADNLGAEVNVQNANGDVEEQIEQIRYLIKKKVDVMVVVAAELYGNFGSHAGGKSSGYSYYIIRPSDPECRHRSLYLF